MRIIGVPSKKIIGYRVMFSMGQFQMYVYMKREYYEIWKYTKDKQIRDVTIEEVEMEAARFLG
ncbi:hypothetical protein [Cohnella lubricantis]|uniref:Uncharacterized protein n=1 Tax=Cohnella lubricantis TaxID=2163172 RepID=A0A841TE69_9BACL|nr:hypothetical protein [Cohnella lubricantis]MBB6677277.1 hypothetical protein [Cohnella lubricantis]MBP2116911.1 hypothetical protein [Cohnella lubricantis]